MIKGTATLLSINGEKQSYLQTTQFQVECLNYKVYTWSFGRFSWKLCKVIGFLYFDNTSSTVIQSVG